MSLEFNSNVKKYLDKGYKDVEELNISKLTLEAAEEALPIEKVDQNGAKKVMLCKLLDKDNKKLTEKQ